mmetsp:Transcript_38709/g.79345  ORF Transcript_38709/g.79345 Transcript_38709/m.79345 type:complete len:206 (+) Transcript_38709:1168-1785(+)
MLDLDPLLEVSGACLARVHLLTAPVKLLVDDDVLGLAVGMLHYVLGIGEGELGVVERARTRLEGLEHRAVRLVEVPNHHHLVGERIDFLMLCDDVRGRAQLLLHKLHDCFFRAGARIEDGLPHGVPLHCREAVDPLRHCQVALFHCVDAREHSLGRISLQLRCCLSIDRMHSLAVAAPRSVPEDHQVGMILNSLVKLVCVELHNV